MFPPRAGWLVLIGLTLLLPSAARSGDFIPSSRMRDPLKQLVFDTRVIEKAEGVRLALGQVVKDSHNPLTQPDKPWEDALDNVYPNLIFDEQDHIFKLWHKCVLDEPAVAAKQASPPLLINGVAWYLCYATSRDGIAWEKPLFDLHRFDGSLAGSPVIKDNELWIYYGGIREVHRGWKRDCHLCLARLRLDGFAGYETTDDSQPGTVLTRPLLCAAEPLRVTADIAKGGELRVEILGEQGCSAGECEPLHANATDAVMRWKSGKSLADFKGKTVRLKFTLRNATLYALSGLRQLPVTP